MTNVIYTGYFVDDPQQLLMQAPVQLKGSDLKVHAHHVTKEFRPRNRLGNVQLGRKVLLTVYAQVINDKVQAVLVRSESGEKLSTNTYPHITIATCNGAKPSDSNAAIATAYDNNKVVYFKEPFSIPATEGYFDGDKNIILS